MKIAELHQHPARSSDAEAARVIALRSRAGIERKGNPDRMRPHFAMSETLQESAADSRHSSSTTVAAGNCRRR